MKKNEIDKMWTQAVLNSLDFEKIMSEKGWVKSTLAKYCGVGMPKMNQYLVGYEGTREEMEKILTGLKAHGVIHAVREAKKAGAEAIEGLVPDFEGDPDEEKLTDEIVETEYERRENIEEMLTGEGWAQTTNDNVRMKLVKEFYAFDAETNFAIMVNVYELELVVFGEPLTRWLTVTADENVTLHDNKQMAFTCARGELMRGDDLEKDKDNN